MNTFKTYDWVDTAKGIGILLVIAGHTIGGNISKIIYLFHMPLFFFLSGYLYTIKPEFTFFKNRVQKLLIPYVIYLFIFSSMIIIKMILNNYGFDKISETILTFIYGGKLLTGWMGVFWFVTVFFISQQILNISINRIGFVSTGILSTILLALSYVFSNYISYPMPLNILVTFYAMPIMYVGLMIKKQEKEIHPIVYIIGCMGCLWFYYHNQMQMQFDMKSSMYGIPVINFILALFLTIVTIQFCNIIKNRYLEVIGRNSMSIMYIHQFLHLSIADRFSTSPFIIFMVTVVLSLLYCMGLNKMTFIIRQRRVN
ncbi:acyltransferase family protein [Raoultella terrigena]|uniref:acyltransferase family protein n=1 Tax=Raoultella terrigena TaxID=577 RepID=UPI001F519930|nr:acyltransferase family protein [Raoultella terrigena]MCI1030805.1 acyltransferase family protein [Raoultella terrigena]